MRRRRHSHFATGAALLGWFALTLQLGLSIQLTLARGEGTLAGVWLWLGFFTITTNLLCAAALTAVAGNPEGPLGRWLAQPQLQTAAAMSIVVVSTIYNLLLRQLWHPHGWQLAADVILHDAMPLLFLLHWWLAVPKTALHWRDIGGWLLYPIGYFFYALGRGAANGWYPYPFLDVGRLGYAHVLLNACAMLLVFIAVATLLVGLGRWQARQSIGGLPAPRRIS
jgi:hypothetical protein